MSIRAFILRFTWPVLVAAACASTVPSGPTVQSGQTAPSGAPPAPTASPSPMSMEEQETEGPTQTPIGARLVQATSCDPALVPGTWALPGPDTSPAPSFRLHIPILMYHRVLPPALADHWLAVSPQEFDAQLTALQGAGWNTITMADLAADLEAGLDPPARSFVITIDDGHYDGYTYALPILQRHGYVATYFVIAGRIGDPDDLTAAELVALTRAGMEIGNHTVDHYALTARSPASVTYEIDTAEATLAAITGSWPQSFAYPRGKHDAAVVAAVRACGPIRIAVVEGGASPEMWVDRYTIPRLEVTSSRTPPILLADVERIARH
jgi:peptidoglycan/xylan/chitin deacetylase (PgdA/CDA1 family)